MVPWPWGAETSTWGSRACRWEDGLHVCTAQRRVRKQSSFALSSGAHLPRRHHSAAQGRAEAEARLAPLRQHLCSAAPCAVLWGRRDVLKQKLGSRPQLEGGTAPLAVKGSLEKVQRLLTTMDRCAKLRSIGRPAPPAAGPGGAQASF